MLLTELSVGESAILLAAPSILPAAFRAGGRVKMVMKRSELSVVESEGVGFALCGGLAASIVVVRAPT
ncbi:MAG: hypothetical protein E7585_01545 [Ruminococcaceae bacterium]|nr:hypothetical protein [Oscillospiraceae bacterium]